MFPNIALALEPRTFFTNVLYNENIINIKNIFLLYLYFNIWSPPTNIRALVWLRSYKINCEYIGIKWKASNSLTQNLSLTFEPSNCLVKFDSPKHHQLLKRKSCKKLFLHSTCPSLYKNDHDLMLNVWNLVRKNLRMLGNSYNIR